VPLKEIDFTHALTLKVKGGLKGGKGGFGSLLRSMNPRTKQVENFDSCRDLTGRRIRDAQNEKRVEEWQKKKEEEEKEVEEENRKYEQQKKAMQAAMRSNLYKIDDEYREQVQ